MSKETPWLLLVFRLPSSRASQRVEIWRKLRRCGALALPSSGYLLPYSAANQERLEWLAAAIRNYKGEASVVQVRVFDDIPDKRLAQMFIDARTREYQVLLGEVNKLLALGPHRQPAGRLSRLSRRFQEIVAIDFFQTPLRRRVEEALARAGEPEAPRGRKQRRGIAGRHLNRVWITRPRPGIDRVSSAWLIRRFIDPKARFIFAKDPTAHPDAVPFDMFVPQGFGHRGEDCSFETLCREFAVRDKRVKRIAQMIHDADLGDEKYGRTEAIGLDRVLNGWAKQELPDDELLTRGMELIEGLYHGLP